MYKLALHAMLAEHAIVCISAFFVIKACFHTDHLQFFGMSHRSQGWGSKETKCHFLYILNYFFNAMFTRKFKYTMVRPILDVLTK